MDVCKLYVASVYVCKKKFDIETYPFIMNSSGIFCKSTIVYHIDKNIYIDLITKEKYKLGINGVSNVGEMYINLENGLIPLHDIFDVEFKSKNMSRRRIVKTLCKSELLNNKEDDK